MKGNSFGLKDLWQEKSGIKGPGGGLFKILTSLL